MEEGAVAGVVAGVGVSDAHGFVGGDEEAVDEKVDDGFVDEVFFQRVFSDDCVTEDDGAEEQNAHLDGLHFGCRRMELSRLENILLIDRACEEDKKPEQFRTQELFSAGQNSG